MWGSSGSLCGIGGLPRPTVHPITMEQLLVEALPVSPRQSLRGLPEWPGVGWGAQAGLLCLPSGSKPSLLPPPQPAGTGCCDSREASIEPCPRDYTAGSRVAFTAWVPGRGGG